MNVQSLLRRQVTTEIKRRHYVFYTITFISLLCFIWILVFGGSGLLRYRQISGSLRSLELEVSELQDENVRLSAFLASYEKNGFLTEKHARESFGLAMPEEYIFMYEKD